MIKEWLLILIMYNATGNGGMTTVEVASQQDCERIGLAFVSATPKVGRRLYLCQPLEQSND